MEPRQSAIERSKKLLAELEGIERVGLIRNRESDALVSTTLDSIFQRIVQLLETGAAAIEALADASEDTDEALKRYESEATKYYELLKVGFLSLT
jgi:hypothetical protein